MHGDPADAFAAVFALVVSEPNSGPVQVHIPRPEKAENLAPSGPGEVVRQQHDQILAVRLLQHPDHVLLRRYIAVIHLHRERSDTLKHRSRLRKAFNALNSPVPRGQHILAVNIGPLGPAFIRHVGQKLVEHGLCKPLHRSDALFPAISEQGPHHRLFFRICRVQHGTLRMCKVQLTPGQEQL